MKQFSDESADDNDTEDEETVDEQSNENEDSEDNEEGPEEGTIQYYIETTREYTKYGSVFIINMNAASVGQLSSNISLCGSNITILYDGS